MIPRNLTDAELLLLGLVAEMPRHGYQVEQVIQERGMREWTQLGFSSIYFVLGQLEKIGLVKARKPAGPKTKKVFSITPAGRRVLAVQSLSALRSIRPAHSSVLLGLIHWPMLPHQEALAALEARRAAISLEIRRLDDLRLRSQYLPDFVEALFEHSVGQLAAELTWATQTMDYMKTKP